MLRRSIHSRVTECDIELTDATLRISALLVSPLRNFNDTHRFEPS
jgi:hypothetical protein